MEAEYSPEKREWPVRHVPLEENTVRKIRQGMWKVVNDAGTGYNAAIEGVDVCGKTGTAQVVSRETKKQFPGAAKDHAWFVGFSSRDNPEIAVVVFVEHGGQGGVAAAPLARQLFATYYNREN